MRTKTDNQKLAAKYHVETRTIRAWRAAGAPLDKPAKMTAWLALRRRMPAVANISTPPAAIPPAGSNHPQQPGAPAALGRMEQAELEAHQRTAAAMARGDLLEIRAAFSHWEKCVEAVRKLSKQVTADMREQGELVPRAEVLKGLRMLGYYMRLASQAQCPAIAFEIVGIPEQVDRYTLLQKCCISQAVLSYAAVKNFVPGWMLDELAADLGNFGIDADEIARVAAALKEAAESFAQLDIAEHREACATEAAKYAKPAV